MTCAKKVVTATLALPDGRSYVGTNACAAPQPVCPRHPGEGYNKCISVCHQYAHAEVDALHQASNPDGGHMTIRGVGHVCEACQDAMRSSGVTWEIRA